MGFFDALQASVWKGQFWADKVNEWLKGHLADIILAILMFIVGWFILKFIGSSLSKFLVRRKYQTSATNFILKSVHIFLLVSLIMLCLEQAGLPTSNFIAAFGAFGIAVGLALQNNMSNFASGVLILLMQPLQVGDCVRINDKEGRVQRIDFMYTEILTVDRRTVFIPNSLVTSQAVVNFSHDDTRLIELYFDIGYNNNHHKAIEVLQDVFKKEKFIINPERTEIGISEFAENSVRIKALPMVRWSNFGPAKYSILSHVKDAFDANGIDIPYPQRVVYVKKEDAHGPNS